MAPSNERLRAVGQLMEHWGEGHLSRKGLHDTPARFLRAFDRFTEGYDKSPKEALKLFEDGAESVDELVMQTDIPVWSLCEHHLLPFFGVVHIGYIPCGTVVGLSKFKRLVEVFARRFQVQERLTQQIAQAIQEYVRPVGVGVVVQCRHTCMESRGVETQGSVTTTSAMYGALRDKSAARAEFLELARKGRPL